MNINILVKSIKFCKHIIQSIRDEMEYKVDDVERRMWIGEYCGRCGAKSHSYEGGKCSCDDECDFWENQKDLSTELLLIELSSSRNIQDIKFPKIDCQSYETLLKSMGIYDQYAMNLKNHLINFPLVLLYIVTDYHIPKLRSF